MYWLMLDSVQRGIVPNDIQMEKTLFLEGTVNALFKSCDGESSFMTTSYIHWI